MLLFNESRSKNKSIARLNEITGVKKLNGKLPHHAGSDRIMASSRRYHHRLKLKITQLSDRFLELELEKLESDGAKDEISQAYKSSKRAI